MARIKIKTTKEDHAKAIKELCIPVMTSTACLVAQAIKRVTGRPCHVGGISAYVEGNKDLVWLPEAVSEAIRKFDQTKEFTEVEFELELDSVKK